MDFEWDDAKRASNLAKHGVDFERFRSIDWTTALTLENIRGRYGERRFVTIGSIEDRLYVAVWTERDATMRLISLRKANKREVKRYEES